MEHLNVPPQNHVKVLDGQGWVGLIDHLGTESTIVNAARVSFGKLKSEMDERDIKDILTAVLYEFPVREIKFALPAWIDVQQSGKIKNELYKDISDTVNKIKRIGDVKQTFGDFTTENGGKAVLDMTDAYRMNGNKR